MWKRLRHELFSLWRWSQRGREGRRVVDARARFWAEVHEGEREAEARLRREPPIPAD